MSTIRIEPLHPEKATGKTKQMLDAVQKKLGMTPNLMRTMAVAPPVLEGYLSMGGALDAGRLSAKVREQIALAVAEWNGCEYCLAAHSTIGGMVGLTSDQIRDSRLGISPDPRTGAVLRLAREILTERGRVSDSELRAARNAGLDEGEIVETVANVALNVFTNYFNLVARTAVDFPAAVPLDTPRATVRAAGNY